MQENHGTEKVEQRNRYVQKEFVYKRNLWTWIPKETF